VSVVGPWIGLTSAAFQTCASWLVLSFGGVAVRTLYLRSEDREFDSRSGRCQLGSG